MIYLVILFLYLLYFFAPLFQEGAIFQLDTVFVPFNSFPNIFEKSLYYFFQEFFIVIFGYELRSKIFFVLIVLSGIYLIYSFSRLLLEYFKKEHLTNKVVVSTVFFSLFSAFFYGRIVTQMWVYFSFIVLGFGIYFLCKNFLLHKNEQSNFLFSMLCFGCSLTILPHSIFFILLIISGYLIFSKTKLSYLSYSMGFIIILGLNINWIIGGFLGNNGVVEKTNEITTSNIELFSSTNLDGISAEITGLLQYGFWGERHFRVLVPGEKSSYWYVFGILLHVIALFGIYVLFKKKDTKRLGKFLLLLLLISRILGVGISSSLWGNMIWLFYEYIPFYGGMRDGHKRIGLVMIIHRIGFIVGVITFFDYLSKKTSKKNSSLLSFIVFIFIVICCYFYNPHSPFILYKQTAFTRWPEGYTVVKESLSKIESGKTVVLPWHSYMKCERTDNAIIPTIYDRFTGNDSVIVADNIEIGELYSNSTSKQSRVIEQFIKDQNIDALMDYGFERIVLLDDCETEIDYSFLDDTPGVESTIVMDSITLYTIGNNDKKNNTE